MLDLEKAIVTESEALKDISSALNGIKDNLGDLVESVTNLEAIYKGFTGGANVVDILKGILDTDSDDEDASDEDDDYLDSELYDEEEYNEDDEDEEDYDEDDDDICEECKCKLKECHQSKPSTKEKKACAPDILESDEKKETEEKKGKKGSLAELILDDSFKDLIEVLSAVEEKLLGNNK